MYVNGYIDGDYWVWYFFLSGTVLANISFQGLFKWKKRRKPRIENTRKMNLGMENLSDYIGSHGILHRNSFFFDSVGETKQRIEKWYLQLTHCFRSLLS